VRVAPRKAINNREDYRYLGCLAIDGKPRRNKTIIDDEEVSTLLYRRRFEKLKQSFDIVSRRHLSALVGIAIGQGKIKGVNQPMIAPSKLQAELEARSEPPAAAGG
jgi:hypothetical protein